MIQTNLEATKDVIQKLLDNQKVLQIPRYRKLQNYYEGKSDILQRPMEDGKPNNKLVANYPGYIVDMAKGYTFGKPISYSSLDEALMEDIQDILNYSDEQQHNRRIATGMGIKGKCYELVYADENSRLRLAKIEADEGIMVYDTAINPEPKFFIRFYTVADLLSSNDTQYAEVYTSDEVITYEYSNGFREIDRVVHYFNMVPVIEYRNNESELGDFEKVITLIDAYDRAASNKVNDLDYFSDAYMYLIGMSGTNTEDILDMRDKKILLLDENGQAGFLIKPSNDTESENVKDRLKQDIHKFSMIPDLTDKEFSGNSSGVALAYKLLGLEQLATEKEANFKLGLQRRFEIICNFLNTKSAKNYDYRDIQITFTRNKPINEKEAIEVAVMLKGLVSEMTVLQNIPQVTDVSEELARLEADKAVYLDLDTVQDDEDM